MIATNRNQLPASIREHRLAADLAVFQAAEAAYQDHLDEDMEIDPYEELGLGHRYNQTLY